MNDIIEHDQHNNLPATTSQAAVNPFQRMHQDAGGMNHAVIEIESQRAIAEAQGKQLLARKFQRSMVQAHAEFMEACKIPEFAAVAFYSVPNRGSGPSIRFAEEAARCYGNFEFGHRELSRDKGRSVVEVYAWDTEKGNHSVRQLTVEHIVDTKNGPKVLRDQADIDNRIANVASKQMRGRILALLPKGLVMAGQAACRRTIAGDNDKSVAQRITAMVDAFAKMGVTVTHLETKLGHKLDTTTSDELVDLIGIYNAIKEGAKASEYFESKETTTDANATTAAAITQQARQASASPAPAAAPAEQKPVTQRATAKKATPAETKATPAPAPAPAQEEAASEPEGQIEGDTQVDDGDVF